MVYASLGMLAIIQCRICLLVGYKKCTDHDIQNYNFLHGCEVLFCHNEGGKYE